MPAAVVKGILLSITIITALGIAVLENPQIQAWLEEQRQKIAELLRSLGEELDPQSRRAAEAFAFEGRTPATDPGIKREASGSLEAAAVATGRSLSNASTIRRIPVKGPADPDEAEERRRKGREYLAKRNQQMYELQERRKSAKADGTATPPTPTSFDAMVDGEGKLKIPEFDKELPSPPTAEPLPDHVRAEMREVERNLMQPLLAGESSAAASGWTLGSRLANPFSDEYAFDRSDTPKPPVPPKVALDSEEQQQENDSRIAHVLGSFTPREASPERSSSNRTKNACHTCRGRKKRCDGAKPCCRHCERGGFICGGYGPSPASLRIPESPRPRIVELESPTPEQNREELSYEEQLAIALSLSEAEAASSANAANSPQHEMEENDAELRAAIEASLKEMNSQKAVRSIETAEPRTPRPLPANPQPLVDLTPPSPTLPAQPAPRGHWETLFDQDYAPTHEPLSLAQSSAFEQPEEEDELYRVTPDLTRARLATLDVQQIASPPSSSTTQSSIPYDPVREAASQPSPAEQSSASSYWSVSELNDFPKYINHFGRDFAGIATHMGTKTPTMVKNHFQRLLDLNFRPELERVANEADQRRARGEDMGSPPSPTPIQKRKYEVQQLAPESPQPQELMEASFYSAASSAPSPASTHTMDHESPDPEQLIDVSEDVVPRTPTTDRSSFGFQTDTESDSDTFASMSRTPSRPRSEISNIEVVDVLEDSDVDMLSEEGDGVATPDSWTEVGSRDGESEMDGSEYLEQRR